MAFPYAGECNSAVNFFPTALGLTPHLQHHLLDSGFQRNVGFARVCLTGNKKRGERSAHPVKYEPLKKI